MSCIATRSIEIGTNKFSTLSFVEKGVIVTKKNKETTTILFSELNKIYIRKHKFSFQSKIGFLSLLLIITAIIAIYLPIEIIMLVSTLSIPLIVMINRHKNYQLYLQLYNGTSFSKGFNNKTKQEHINLVNRIRNEIFDNHKFNIQIIKSIENKEE